MSEELEKKWHKLLKILFKKDIINFDEQDELELDARKEYERERAWNN